MKASDLSALPTNGLWHVYFKVGTTTYFTSVFNHPISGLQYEDGHVGTGSDTTDGDADGGSVSTANNTITVFVANSKVGSPGVGTMLTGIYGRTITLVGAQVPGVGGGGGYATHDYAPNTAPTSSASYTLAGNSSCPATAASPTPTPTPTPIGTPSNAP